MRYVIREEKSTVIVEARSSMGPIVFQSQMANGWVDADVVDGSLQTNPGPSGSLVVDLDSLQSGNDIYDAELRRRIDSRRHPTCELELSSTQPLSERRFQLTGTMTFHGVTRPVDGTVEVEAADDDRLVVTGQKLLDLRDFNIPPPGILMLKIYPDVDVHLFVEAVADPSTGGSP